MDQTQTRLPRTARTDCLCDFILLRPAQFNTRRDLLLPTDRPLRRLDIDHVLGVFPNDCNHMVLWREAVVEEYQANDRQGTITLFPIVLARHWTTSVDRNIFDSNLNAKEIEGIFYLQSLWIFSLINYQPPTFHNGTYTYPGWAHGLGWSIAAASLICIPTYAIVNIVRAQGDTFLEVNKSEDSIPTLLARKS